MPERDSRDRLGFVASEDQPLIGIPVVEDHQELVHYFVDENAADATMTTQGIQRALNMAGAWQNMAEWAEVEQDLADIRGANPPTPPIEL